MGLDATSELLEFRIQRLRILSQARESGGGSALVKGSGTRAVFDLLADDPSLARGVSLGRTQDLVVTVHDHQADPGIALTREHVLLTGDGETKARIVGALREFPKQVGPVPEHAIPITRELAKALEVLLGPMADLSPDRVKVRGEQGERLLTMTAWDDPARRRSVIQQVTWRTLPKTLR
jgi:hypothetical protein